MSAEITVPQLGESIVEATVGQWRKHEGDTVNAGDVLVELETDKVNVEVSAQQSGVLQHIARHEGDTVAVGDVLGTISEEVSAARPEAQPPEQTTAERLVEQRAPAAKAPATQQPQPAPAEATSEAEHEPEEVSADGQQTVSPLARRIAAEYNVDLAQVQASVTHNRVTREDVLNYIEQHGKPQAAAQRPAGQSTPAAPTETTEPSAAPPVAAARPAPVPSVAPASVSGAVAQGREERIRLSRRRLTIAQRLVEAQHTAAMLTTFNEIDMSAVMEIRSRRRESFKERYGVSLGFMSFFTKAVVGALKAYPQLNSEIQGNELVLKRYYDIGIAVGAEEGLIVPVLRDADRKSFAEIEREIADLARRARENKLSLAELQGGTFTITNGGVFGSLLSTPILNGPQAGILGMHKIEQRPVVVNNEVVVRPMMYVALSYDHRIVDGREAVQFLVRVKELVEDPEALLLEG